MKTNFQQRFNRARIPSFKIGVGVFFLLVAALFSSSLGELSSVVVSPLYTVRTWLTTSEASLPRYFRDRTKLGEEIEQLQSALAQSAYDTSRLAVLEAENALLRNIHTTVEHPRIIADVVRRPNETPYDTLVVHKGAVDGVVEGALVYADKTVIGTVVRVFPESALVMLFSTAEVRSPVYVYGPDIFAHAYGMGGGVIRVSVPQGIAIAVGDPVTIPIEDSSIYGRVTHVESVESNPEQYAYVTQEPVLQHIRFVAIDSFAMPVFSYEDAVQSIEGARAHATTSPLSVFIETLPVASTTASTTSNSP